MIDHFEPLVHSGKLLDGLELGEVLLFRADRGGHRLAWDNLNAETLRLWREHFPDDEEEALAPLFYPDHGPVELLFVGFNPSFNIAETQARAPAGLDVNDFYRWQGFAEDRIPIMQAVQHQFIQDFAYFTPMQNIAHYAEMTWAHIDLYPLRNTRQNETIEYFRNRPILKESLELLFQTTVYAIRPQIIVVANAYASRCVERLFGEDLSFDETVGFHRLEMDEDEAAVFFSGMLTGQRALDTGSFKRLRWHVRRAAVTLKSAKTAMDRRGHMSWGPGDIEIHD
ncbi:hypothetical protein NKH85_15755 [Mesorhizobium sp. M0924]|uniref:hypothetical protein n=1 Tax=unclassified Mesorhizobium TaxID=325217 RepID=UPI00333A43BB